MCSRAHGGVALALAGALAWVAGCAPSLATVQPARLVPAGHVQLGVSAQVTPPVGAAGDAIDAARALDGLGRRIDPDELETVGEAAAGTLVQPPGVTTRVALHYGLAERFEGGLLVDSGGMGGTLRAQLWRVAPGFYGAAGVGVHATWVPFPVEHFEDRAEVERYRRREVSIPLSVGWSRRALHLWAGPKLAFARYDADVRVCVQEGDARCRQAAEVRVDARARFLAGQLGMAFGGRRAWIAVEVTVARMWVDGGVDLSLDRTTMHRGYGRDGRVITPAVGFLGWF